MAWRKSTGNTIVDSYVVRIYRRTAPRNDGSGTLVGLVEDVRDSGKRHAFHSISELWDVLGVGGTTTSAGPRGRRSPDGHGDRSS